MPPLTLSTAMSQSVMWFHKRVAFCSPFITACRRLDSLLSTYTQLADMLLYTIRLEVRTRAMAYLHASLSKVSDSLTPLLPAHADGATSGQLPNRCG